MGILAQWLFTTTNSLLPTRADSSIEIGRLMCETDNGAATVPRFTTAPTGGYYAVRQSGWQANTKYWHVEMTPDADMGITNVSFQSYINKTNGPTHFTIAKYVDNVHVQTWGPYVFTGNTNVPITTNQWYGWSQDWPTNGPITLPAGQTTQIRIYGKGGNTNSIGTFWSIYNLTFLQGSVGTNGITEVTDEEFTSGSYKLLGSTWDDDSGIWLTNAVDEAKRPRYSMNAPDNGVFATNVPFAFTADELADGDVKLETEGEFEAPLPRPSYTNVMLGEYLGRASVWDFDDDRTEDDLQMVGDLAMYLVDNDVTPPGSVGNVYVNGIAVPGTPPDRYSAAWSNTPEFLVTFDDVAHDQEANVNTTTEKQRAVAGIGEYRVTTNNVVGMNPTNRAALGTPYPVATTNGALANGGFELDGVGWTLDGNSTIQWLQLDDSAVREGTNSLKQVNAGVAYQLIEFRNLAAVAPIVGASGWYRSDSAANATFRIDAFATNDLATPVDTETLSLVPTGTNWTQFALDPAVAVGDETTEVLKISLIDGGGNTTYWDGLRLSVDIGTNLPSMRFVAGIENQGLSNPQYLFAVDADNNRALDRLAGEAKPFYIAYDVTPPTAVGASQPLTASTETVDDPTTQFDLQWSTFNVGPDDPVHDNHPTKVATDRDILSPWRSYKIYYGTFDATVVPDGDPGPGNASAYIYSTFIANDAYLAWSNVAWNSTILDPSATGLTNYNALTNLPNNRIRLYDLDFDQDYAVVIVGVDKAGNQGGAGVFSWATNNTIKFALTRGWTLPKTEAETYFPNAPTLQRTEVERAAGLAWLAAGNTNALSTGVADRYVNVSKDYDLIYMDAPSFKESISNEWKLLGTVRTNWFVDDGGQARGRGQVRFYRASYKDRWKTFANGRPQRPLASEEVYALHNVLLSPGPNVVGFHGIPYTNTFYGMFGGLESFPGGTAVNPANGSTVVEFYSAGTNALTSAQYWLDTEGNWKNSAGTVVTHDVQPPDFFNRGFSIHLPPAGDPSWETYATTTALDYNRLDESNRPVVVSAMVWSAIAQVPTNAAGFSHTIHCGNRRTYPPSLVYNLVALRLPVAAHPFNMKFVENGFIGGTEGSSDVIYTIDTTTKDVMDGRLMYYDTTITVPAYENWKRWQFVGGGTNDYVPWGYFKPNDVIVIVSKNGGLDNTWTWSYTPTNFYAIPTRWMGWTNVPPPPEGLAPEPTVNATTIAFANVSATQIGVNWSSGNGARRIVVVKAGSMPDWVPSDSVAPSGVSSDFSGATDQGNGNKICYDGTGTGFLLQILQPSTTYYFKVYEYNGTGTGVNYLTTDVLYGYQLTL
ncbi:MAG: hypothetical protein EOL90_10545 [Spartobacteria bacterium]|nr:hypothetical protein [Spartobacteria bacterium]